MICVERFHFDGDDGVVCPGCQITVVLPPPVQSLMTFICPLCNKRYTLESDREEVERLLDEMTGLDPGE